MARLYPRKDRNGRKVWYIDYSAQDPSTGTLVRKRERVGYSKEGAQAALESRLTDIRRGKFDGIFPEPTCTLKQIWDRYRKHSIATKSAQVVEREKGIYEKHLEPEFGDHALNRITPEQVEGFQAKRKAEKRSPATVNKEVQLLKNIVKKAQDWGFIKKEQISCVKPLKEPPGRVRYLSGDEFAKLLSKCPGWLRPIVMIAAYTGMRRGEVCGLQRAHIDRKNRMIRLERTKNNEARVVPIHPAVEPVLDNLPARLDSTYLFTERDGSPISKGRVTVAFRRARKKAGIKNFRLHDLRHNFASHLTMRGQNQRTVMELLGHKDPRMTTRYQHLSMDYLRDAVSSLEYSEALDSK